MQKQPENLKNTHTHKMCLFETKIKNLKYQPNISNNGKPAKCNDYRKLWIRVGCGWCEECRKELATTWKIRLYEEIKENPNATYVTFSYSPESLQKMEEEIHDKSYKGIEGEDTDVNIMAAYSLRMWGERWRKRFKKAPKHWMVTELGHQNSERLHLHGIVWNTTGLPQKEFEEAIQKSWGNGNVDFGTYVNEKTINYITKYVTKLDDYHKGYKQKIFTSKGIGLGYLKTGKTMNAYNGKKTIKYYRAWNGYKLKLPSYYKKKIWTDEERENLWTMELDKEKTYLDKQEYDLTNEDEKYVEKFANALKGRRNSNKLAGYGDNKTKNDKYIITDAMKMNYKDLINYDKTKLVKKTSRRKIEKILKWDKRKDHPIQKTRDIDHIIYGEYEGTTTQAERDYNKLYKDAKILGITVRELRLITNGIFTVNEVVPTKTFTNEKDRLLWTLTRKKYVSLQTKR